MRLSLSVNGKSVELEVAPHELLSEVLRERLALTGTHIGCDTSQCGACVVHVDGASVKSCSVFALSLQGAKVTTIEGLGLTTALHPMQRAFHENHGLQCGFCTPGMVMTAVEFAQSKQEDTEANVRHCLEGNLCRCTGYHNIVASVLAGTAAMRAQKGG